MSVSRWFYGRAAIRSVVESSPECVDRLILAREQLVEHQDLAVLAKKKRIPVEWQGETKISRLVESSRHQGVAALLQVPKPKLFQEVLSSSGKTDKKYEFIVYSDGVSNPHNLGSIWRAMAHFGLSAWIQGNEDSEDPVAHGAWTPASFRMAQGGALFVDVLMGSGRTHDYTRLRELGYRLIGTSVDRAVPYTSISWKGPVCLVLGNEEKGTASHNAISDWVTIPGSGRVESLNVSTAASILFAHAVHERAKSS